MFSKLSAQNLVANAGNDTNYCINFYNTQWDTTIIGGNPSAIGGHPPYKYRWYINPFQVFGSSYFYAHNILLDTTVANPKIYNPSKSNNDTGTTLYLEVTDSLGQTALDSMKITFSSYVGLLGVDVQYINEGDSAFSSYCNTVGGIHPLTYLWEPSISLVDSTLPYPGWMKPIVETHYFCKITDKYGCAITAGTSVIVFVTPLSTYDLDINTDIVFYPNPVNDMLYIKSKKYTIKNWQLYSLNGQLVKQSNSNNLINIDCSKLATGVYNLKIITDKGVYSKQVIKQ